MEEIYKIMVPTDFTSVADTAIQHAITISKIMKGEIVLLHVIDKDGKTLEAQNKLDKIAETLNKENNVPTVGKVITGNIFDDIVKVAEYEGVSLIIMGTHGRKGIQHIVGSYAMKVITSSEIPFIVVQDKLAPPSYQNIVFPIDFKAETKLKLALTVNMASHLGAKIHIYGEFDNDPFNKQHIDNNIANAKRFFTEHNVPYTVKIAEKSGSFVKQILHYSVSINADMIVVLNLNYRSISNLLKNDEEELVSNEAQIPVFMVNPSKSFLAKSILFEKKYSSF